MHSHPDNQGLSRAYNNSLSLGERFSQKTAMKFTRVQGKDNKTIIRAERLDIREQTRAENNVTPAETMVRDKNENREKTSDQKNTISATLRSPPNPGTGKNQGRKRRKMKR